MVSAGSPRQRISDNPRRLSGPSNVRATPKRAVRVGKTQSAYKKHQPWARSALVTTPTMSTPSAMHTIKSRRKVSHPLMLRRCLEKYLRQIQCPWNSVDLGIGVCNELIHLVSEQSRVLTVGWELRRALTYARFQTYERSRHAERWDSGTHFPENICKRVRFY